MPSEALPRTMPNPARRWVFTLNNYDSALWYPADGAGPLAAADEGIVRCGVYQAEIGASGTRHIQGYIELGKPHRLAAVKRHLPCLSAAHLEPARGTRDQACDYCTKEDTRDVDYEPVKFGDWSAGGQGVRNDLEAIKQLVDDGKSEAELWDHDFGTMARYHKAILHYKRIKIEPRSTPPEVYVYYGDTGTGKTRRAAEFGDSIYYKPPGGLWFDGYSQQSVCVIDDFAGWLPFTFLLRLIDRYPMQVEVKGSYTEFTSETIIITSNNPPEEWYNWEALKHHNGKEALLRRITQIHHFVRTSPTQVNVNRIK